MSFTFHQSSVKHKGLDAAIQMVGQVIVGKPTVIIQLFTTLLARGHCLLEDVPGLGKSRLVRAFADVTACAFRRIQFTSDVLPGDVTGMMVFDRDSRAFTFREGPIFGQVVLADELNRASPRTQSALLEAMEEAQVTMDGVSYPLPRPFMMVATQNPVEFEATFPLPEAQLDRFMMRLSIGYPEFDDEVALLGHASKGEQNRLSSALTPEQMVLWQREVDAVFVHPSMKDYIVRMVRETRNHALVRLGVSPRGGIHLIQAAKALAFIQGRTFVVPDDVQRLVDPVLAHRIVLTPEARLKGKRSSDVLVRIVQDTQVPPLGETEWSGR